MHKVIVMLSLSSLIATGCVNGKLSPVVTAGAQAAGKACALIPDTARAGSIPGQVICEAVSSILAEVFSLFNAPATPAVLPTKAAPLEGVVHNGVTIAVWPAPQAMRLRQRLATDPVFAARVTDAMAEAKQ